MAISVTICDDSNMARQQMKRALPVSWDVAVTFAQHGREALEALRQGRGDILFLDLNMPEMDGYETLKAIRQTSLDTKTIVVSGDIQPEANQRVMDLGALAFIKKPIQPDKLFELLQNLGLHTTQSQQEIPAKLLSIELLDGMQEVANVAMGRSADLLARLLNTFIKLPIPKVSLVDCGDLQMALSMAQHGATYSAVCQGFIGAGIAGEALLIFDDANFPDMAKLLNRQGEINKTDELELLMDMASILTGSCITGIGQQLDINFSQSHPMVLGQHVDIAELVKSSAQRWTQTLAIEITYQIENHNITCDLLLLFTEDSLSSIKQRFSYLFS